MFWKKFREDILKRIKINRESVEELTGRVQKLEQSKNNIENHSHPFPEDISDRIKKLEQLEGHSHPFPQDMLDKIQEMGVAIKKVEQDLGLKIDQHSHPFPVFLVEETIKKFGYGDQIERLRAYYLQEYLSSVERVFDFIKTISVITSISSKDTIGIKKELLAPVAQEKYAQKVADLNTKLNDKGAGWILEKRKTLQDEKVSLDMNNKDISKVEAQIRLVDEILEALR